MKILNFKNFELSINEAEQIDETITLTSQIMSTFFDIYSFILPSAEGYSGIIKDIESMVDGDANDKETAMEAIKGSILGAVSEDAKKAEFYKDTETAFSLVIGSYKKMIAQFEKDKDTEDLKKVASEVSKSAVRFMDSLKDSKKSVPEIKESIEYTPNDINEAIRNKMEEPGTSLKPTLTKLSSELDNIAKKVEDDKYWKDIKRKERNTELEEITNRVTQIPMEISAEKDKLFKSMDSNKDSIAELKKAMDSIKKATEAKEKFTAEKINAETEKKEEPEDKKEDKKDDKEFSDIDPKDPDNMRKVGKNRESIEAMQVATNKILGEVEGYKKIDEDGLYGKNTTEAFKKAQDLLNKLGAGLNTEGKLSASVQKAFTNFVEKKEEISKLITK